VGPEKADTCEKFKGFLKINNKLQKIQCTKFRNLYSSNEHMQFSSQNIIHETVQKIICEAIQKLYKKQLTNYTNQSTIYT